MFDEDCLGIPFVMSRPKASIADPGRIKIKSVCQYVVSTANFISDNRMRQDIIRQYDRK